MRVPNVSYLIYMGFTDRLSIRVENFRKIEKRKCKIGSINYRIIYVDTDFRNENGRDK